MSPWLWGALGIGGAILASKFLGGSSGGFSKADGGLDGIDDDSVGGNQLVTDKVPGRASSNPLSTSQRTRIAAESNVALNQAGAYSPDNLRIGNEYARSRGLSIVPVGGTYTPAGSTSPSSVHLISGAVTQTISNSSSLSGEKRSPLFSQLRTVGKF